MNRPVVRCRVVELVVVRVADKDSVLGKQVIYARLMKVNRECLPRCFVILRDRFVNPRHEISIEFSIERIFHVLCGCFASSVFDEVCVSHLCIPF